MVVRRIAVLVCVLLVFAGCGGGGGAPSAAAPEDGGGGGGGEEPRLGLASGQVGIYLSLILSRGTSTDCSLWRYGLPCDTTYSSERAGILYVVDSDEAGVITDPAPSAPFWESTSRGMYATNSVSWHSWDTSKSELGPRVAPRGYAPWTDIISGDLVRTGWDEGPATMQDMSDGSSWATDPPVWLFFGDAGNWNHMVSDDVIDFSFRPWDPLTWSSAGQVTGIPRMPIGTFVGTFEGAHYTQDGNNVYVIRHRQTNGADDRIDLWRHDGGQWQMLYDVQLPTPPAGWRAIPNGGVGNGTELDVHEGCLIYHAWEQGLWYLDIASGYSFILEVGIEIQDMAVYRQP